MAVDGVSFTCRDGEVFGLLGPNGAGKTTLLRLIASVLEPTAGAALVDGLNARRESARVRARVGLLVDRIVVHDQRGTRRRGTSPSESFHE